MGNCAPKPRDRSPPAPATPATPAKATSSLVRLHGSETSPVTCWIRAALLYKTASVQFFPSDGEPILRCGSDTVTGPAESMLRYLDSRLGGPPASLAEGGRRSAAEVFKTVTALQHRSMGRHVGELARLAAELVAGGGGRATEARRMGRRYGQLVEVMLEHARMEERLLFPALELAGDDPGFCRTANEEHARDLPLMNGIKEDIKSLVAMDPGLSFYHEALLNLSHRLTTLQERCKEHFESEERELLPLLEVAERNGSDELELPPGSSGRWVEQVMDAMEATHSHLFPFFMAGLLPDEAMQYIHLVCRYIRDQQRLVRMLQSLIAKGKPPVAGIPSSSLKSWFNNMEA